VSETTLAGLARNCVADQDHDADGPRACNAPEVRYRLHPSRARVMDGPLRPARAKLRWPTPAYSMARNAMLHPIPRSTEATLRAVGQRATVSADVETGSQPARGGLRTDTYPCRPRDQLCDPGTISSVSRRPTARPLPSLRLVLGASISGGP